jgi:DNA helicase HerA-like ATPase
MDTNEKSSLRSEVQALLDYIETSKGESAEVEVGELTPESVARDLAYEKAPRLNIFYLPEPELARLTARRLIERLLYLRKHGASRKRILFVFDEAQEYIPDNPRERDGTLDSNRAVEALLRQGRKYRLHCWLATQRVAHLNVSALQQLHSYFVSTLPRFYDRMVIADSFGLPYEVMERSAQLDTGEWLFVSFKAAKQKNVPVFVKTENNEDVLTRYLAGRK